MHLFLYRSGSKALAPETIWPSLDWLVSANEKEAKTKKSYYCTIQTFIPYGMKPVNPYWGWHLWSDWLQLALADVVAWFAQQPPPAIHSFHFLIAKVITQTCHVMLAPTGAFYVMMHYYHRSGTNPSFLKFHSAQHNSVTFLALNCYNIISATQDKSRHLMQTHQNI